MCLDPWPSAAGRERALLDECLHAFCVACVRALAAAQGGAAACPLCRAPVRGMIRPTRADGAFERLPLEPDEGLRRRREVYARGLRAEPLPAGRAAGAPDFTARDLPRLGPWLSRELAAACGLGDAGGVGIEREAVLGLLRGGVPLGSARAEAALAPLLGARASLFLNELAVFLRGGRETPSYDRLVRYPFTAQPPQPQPAAGPRGT